MRIDVKKIAALSKISITADEEKALGSQLEETLKYIESLNKVDTSSVEPTSQVTGLENVEREDVATPSLSQKEALLNSKSTQNGFFKVKGVLKNE